MDDPLVSIVIANYNYGRFIETAIRSVTSQEGFDKCELIIVDGGSTDNSVNVIRKFERDIAWWCSEKDGGQSEAFNKGFSHANGLFLTWLNADDIMMPQTISRLQAALIRHPQCKWFAGGTIWLDPCGRPFRCVRARPFSMFLLRHGHIPVWGPSSFFSRAMYNQTFGFRDNYHYMMDTDLWFRFHYEQGATYELLPGYVWGFRIHADAKTSGYRFQNSDMHDASSRRRLAQEEESRDMRSRYPTKPIRLVTRLLHFDWWLRVCEIVDLIVIKCRGVAWL